MGRDWRGRGHVRLGTSAVVVGVVGWGVRHGRG